ncbi:MAG: hypothetical protein ACRDL4_07625 [Thermoleophilaceae bacterium]
MSAEDQLRWESRWARPAAAAAFAAGLLLLAGTALFQSILEDRPGNESLPDFLLSVDESPGTLIASSALQATASLAVIPVFYYLFRAIVHRIKKIPPWFVYLIIIGPTMYAISQVLAGVDRIDVAETFAAQDYSFPDAESGSNLADCPRIPGELGADCAEELLRENPNGLAIALSLLGSVSVAFMYVMLPLRARRAGILSPFMSILGPVAGVLLVLQLLPLVPVVIQAFWLGAVGALFLGNWPGGRGPAWESGEPDPWPTPAQRRGLGAAGGGGAAETEQAAETEPAAETKQAAGGEPAAAEPADPKPVPERPSSRKRRKRR